MNSKLSYKQAVRIKIYNELKNFLDLPPFNELWTTKNGDKAMIKKREITYPHELIERVLKSYIYPLEKVIRKKYKDYRYMWE
jgi:hypothetical protein